MLSKSEKLKRKLLALFLGLLFCVVILEFCLITIDFFNNRRQTGSIKKNKSQKDEVVILGLGNSFTEGQGAPPGEGYLDHLGQILSSRIKNKKFHIVNKGEGNLNSAEILRRIEKNINEIKPDLIILRAGQPNWWQYNGYSDYLERESLIRSFKQKIQYRLYDFFYQFHFIRLFLMLSDIKNQNQYINFVPKIRKAKNCHLEKPYKIWPANSIALKAFQAIPFNDGMNYNQKIPKNILKSSSFINQSIKAADLFKQASQNEPGNPTNYAYLGYINFYYLGKHQEGISDFIKGIKVDKGVNPEFWENNYKLLKDAYKKTNDQKARQTITGFIQKLNQSCTEKAQALTLDNKNSADWAKSDIKEMIRIAKQKGIKLIIQNYPAIPAFYLANEINAILRQTAKEFKIPFVDNEKIFQQMWDKGEDINNYHSYGNPHPNSKGYRVMAENVYQILVSSGILNGL